MTLEEARKIYARDIAALVNSRSERLQQALATVPRENFLGPGPWTIAKAGSPPVTPDDDPVHLYSDASVALDKDRSLYNGNPGNVIAWIDALRLSEGERVFHLGGATGYYTAILAAMVGDRGHVLMAEVDHVLGAQAQRNLAAAQNVEVVVEDGGALNPGPCDAILVNAGVTHPRREWLDCLKEGGRMVLPLTIQFPNSNLGKGAILLITRQPGGFAASLLTRPVVIFSCTSVRDDATGNALLQSFSAKMPLDSVRSLRVDDHQPAATCWVHTDRICLSSETV